MFGFDSPLAPSPPPSPNILTAHTFSIHQVRGYAALCLEKMKDETLSQYILQLTQTLKHEPFHDSGLARFLLRRAIRNTRLLGHQFFWSLKAEMHDPTVSDRYGVLLDMYRRNCGAHRGELGHQLFLMRQLQNASDIVKPIKDKKERKRILADRLKYVNEQLRDVDVFQLPLDPHMVSTGIILEKSRVMSSKQAPIWLTFENAVDPSNPHVVMFKAGDDLRQDQLTLQVLHVMDTLWQGEGLDFRLNAYKCVSTGWEQGMLEIVQNAATVAGIIEDGAKERTGLTGSKLARQAAKDAYFRKQTIADWLLQQAKKFDPAMWNGLYGDGTTRVGNIKKSIMLRDRVDASMFRGMSGRNLLAAKDKEDASIATSKEKRNKKKSHSSISRKSSDPGVRRSGKKWSSSEAPGGFESRHATRHRRTGSEAVGTKKANPVNSRAQTINLLAHGRTGTMPNMSGHRNHADGGASNLADNLNLVHRNFMMSSAGYCAATYVLGIGDRHNDNYMIRKDGCFFHIDFGHFLGNFKSKFGIKRETAPFIFTMAMKFAIGQRFGEFESLACDAYMILRKHANLLITMFSLMVSSGMPELQTDDDISWLRDMLMLDSADEAAADHFKRKIEEAHGNKRVRLNDVAHLLKHVG